MSAYFVEADSLPTGSDPDSAELFVDLFLKLSEAIKEESMITNEHNCPLICKMDSYVSAEAVCSSL